MALRRFFCLENRFRRDPEYKEKYIEFMTEYARLGHMKLATESNPTDLHNYIPHHAVLIEKKFRVVFDGSAKTTNGKSLNDIQYTGPRLQKDLLDIIIKFRTGRIAMTADICKMFRQVEIQPIHWDLQRILWRSDTKEPIRDYWLTVVTYGLAASPYLAVKALKQCASDAEKEMPRAAQVVQNDFYMDDLLTSVESEPQANTLKLELTELLHRGGFELAKWRSNCSQIMESEMSAKIVELQTNTSILGVVWDFVKDEFRFRVEERDQPKVINKRYITSEAARIFDPQGWVTPVTIRAKLFIQELWRLGSSWDEPLLLSIQQEWKYFYEELKLINELRIPRWFETSNQQETQIHMFSDASNKAYGVAVYVRIKSKGQWRANLVCARSRVAPIKLVTIPRLELCAMELSCKLIPKIREIPMFEMAPISIWTDSEIVLHWLRKPSNELRPFVANRVSKILRGSTLEQFRYIKSNQNPADLISRGIKTENLLTNQLWWHGPDVLRECVTQWPSWVPKTASNELLGQIKSECKEPPVKFDNVLLTVVREDKQEIELMNKISSYEEVCRVTAYLFRFCKLCFEPVKRRRIKEGSDKVNNILDNHKPPEPNKSNLVAVMLGAKKRFIPRLSINEIDNALNYWLVISQKQSFPKEYKAMTRNQGLSKSSRLWALTPWMDDKKLLRIRGRLDNAELP